MSSMASLLFATKSTYYRVDEEEEIVAVKKKLNHFRNVQNGNARFGEKKNKKKTLLMSKLVRRRISVLHFRILTEVRVLGHS